MCTEVQRVNIEMRFSQWVKGATKEERLASVFGLIIGMVGALFVLTLLWWKGWLPL